FFALSLCLIFTTASFAQTMRTINVITEPNAVIWINDVRFGKTDKSGKLILNVASGAKTIRVRAEGFKETKQNLLAAQKGDVKIVLVKTTDEAEITFQKAEKMASVDEEKAIELYRKAISLRPKYAEAYVEIARILGENGETEDALEAIKQARKIRPIYAEASAVEGRIYKTASEEENAIASFKKSIAEGKGFQPEAHTGLGMIYREKAESFGSTGDFDSEKEYYLLAAGELKKAVAQLAGAPDAITIYQLLGDCYERAKMYKEAIAVYEEFLKIYPNANEAVTVRSFITQIKKQMAEQ
nr:tetratricopeptide repeat protein [Pyrinomonadaceae bacterium]